MNQQYCPVCREPFMSTSGLPCCPNGHIFLPVYNFTTTTTTGTSTSGYIYISKPEPARTPVPDAFYQAFEEDERRRQAQLDALADIAHKEEDEGTYD